MRKKVLCLLSLLVGAPASAEPTPTVSFLMDEPASMFDIGMMRLRNQNKFKWIPEVEAQVSPLGLASENPGVGNVVYKWDENTITITVVFIGTPTEERCESTLEKYLDVIAPSRNREYDFWKLFLANDFGHINYSSSTYPDDWHEEIVKLFRVVVGIREMPLRQDDQVRMGPNPTIFCESRIDVDGISFSKFDM